MLNDALIYTSYTNSGSWKAFAELPLVWPPWELVFQISSQCREHNWLRAPATWLWHSLPGLFQGHLSHVLLLVIDWVWQENYGKLIPGACKTLLMNDFGRGLPSILAELPLQVPAVQNTSTWTSFFLSILHSEWDSCHLRMALPASPKSLCVSSHINTTCWESCILWICWLLFSKKQLSAHLTGHAPCVLTVLSVNYVLAHWLFHREVLWSLASKTPPVEIVFACLHASWLLRNSVNYKII